MRPQDVTEYMKAVGAGVGELSKQMKQPAEQVYELFLRQNYVNAVLGCLLIVGAFVATIFYVKFLKWGMESVRTEYGKRTRFYNSEGLMVIAIVSGISLVILDLIILLVSVGDVVARFINPHYMTIQDIIKLVKPN